MLDSNRKGAIAEAKIATAAIELGIPVLRPMAEHGRYDLAFDIGTRIFKVQCKWAGLDERRGAMRINLRCSSCTPGGYSSSQYADGEIDLLAAYCGELDRCYLLPSALAVRRGGIHLRVSPARNGQRACINLASEFEFAGAVAQLEERLAGSEEARGSSPLSSTPAERSTHVTTMGAHQFRNRFGYYMERAAAGDEIHITRRGRRFARLMPPTV